MMFISVIVTIAAILTVASNSIGVQCYNNNETYKKDHESKFRFTVLCLVLAIIGLICGGAGMIMAYRE